MITTTVGDRIIKIKAKVAKSDVYMLCFNHSLSLFFVDVVLALGLFVFD